MAEGASAASSRLARVSRHFRDQVEARWSSGRTVCRDDDGNLKYEEKFFLRHGLAVHIISRQELESEIIGHILVPRPENKHSYIQRILDSSDDRSSESIGSGLQSILLIILLFGKQSMLDSFEKKFLLGKAGGKNRDLPFDKNTTRDIFGSEDWTSFFNLQFKFAPVTIAEGSYNHQYPYDRYLLPYQEHMEVGRGAFGRVFKVKIAQGHYKSLEPGTRNHDPVWLARKEFASNNQFNAAFRAETEIQKTFREASDCPSSIVKATSSYEHLQDPSQPSTFLSASIFFPFAEYNLSQYIRNPTNFPGASQEKRKQHVKQMIDVSGALKWLAEHLTYKPDDGQYVYRTTYHCDLKPDNILVYKNQDPLNSVVFKISDFGEALGVHLPVDSKAKDTKFEVAGRERTFLAPESQEVQSKPEVTSKSDIWAFGCILLLVILFNYDGAAEIEQFDDERVRNSPDDRKGDHFFNPVARNVAASRFKTDESTTECNTAVTKYMINLINRTEERQTRDDDAKLAHDALKYTKENILVLHNRRHGIKQVNETLLKLFKRSPILASRISHQDVRMPICKSSQHCGTSVNGSVLFYTPSLIRIYSAQSNSFCTVQRTASEEWSDGVPVSRLCSDRRLCFVTAKPRSDQSFKCTIHTFAGEPNYPRHLELKELQRRDNHFQRAALSPDGVMLAVACKTSEFCGSICLYSLDRIRQSDSARATTTDSSSTRTTSSHTLDSATLLVNKAFTKTKYIIDLCFSRDNNKLYYIAETDPAPSTLITAICRSPDGTWPTKVNTPAGSWNFSHRKGFLRTVVPFNNAVGVIYIDQDQRIAEVHENQPIRFYNMGNGRMLNTILITSDDERIVILADSDKGNLEICGGFLKSLPITKPLLIMDKVKYRPSTDIAYLSEEENRVILQLTIFEERTTLRFPLDRLFEDDTATRC